MKFRSIRAKLLFFSLGGTMLLAMCLTALVYSDYKRNLSDELGRRGHILALGISSSVQKAMLTGNPVRIKYIVDLYKRLDPDITYVVIADKQGEIIYHTFKKGFPGDLREVLSINKHDTLMDTESGLVRNIPSLIFGGEAGVAHIGLSEERVRQQMRRNLRVMLLIVFLVGTAGVIVILNLSRSVTRPIDDVIHAAKEYGSGTYDHRIRVSSSDETGQLAMAFNKMADEITDNQKKILQAEKLAAIGRLAAGIAHEINNPIMGIRNCINLIGSVTALPEKEIKYKTLINDSLTGMENVVRNLLSFSRSHDDAKQLFSPFDIMRETADFLSHIAEKNGVSFDFVSGDHTGYSFGSINEFQQVAMNLFMNAMDAMPDGGKIVVSSVIPHGEEFVEVTVTDTGIGIQRESLDKIFEPFFTTKEPGRGTGLGLYVCHQIITRMGGTIEAKLKSGGGTEFALRMPIAEKEMS